MKHIKKWLFPVLTCLIVAGAAVLPQRVSEAKDARQFGQAHTEELNADNLPAAEPPTLLNRLTLYARWGTPSETVPSFQEQEADGDLVVRVLDCLAQAEIIPSHLLKPPFSLNDMERILLWDPAVSVGRQEPMEFWQALIELGKGSMWIRIDSASGLPLELSLYDPNIAQWLAYKDPDALPYLAGNFFDLLELDAEETDTDILWDYAPWERLYSVKGTNIIYYISFQGTMLDIKLERNGSVTSSGSGSYDG